MTDAHKVSPTREQVIAWLNALPKAELDRMIDDAMVRVRVKEMGLEAARRA